MKRRDWKHFHPNTLRDALQGCKDFALERNRLSVERIAERMGLEDHWALYKWLANGRMPLVLVPAYELACGTDFVTRWLAASSHKLLVNMPTGRTVQAADMVALNSGFASALQLLTDFYAADGSPDPAATLDALRSHLEQVAYHHHNVTQYVTPQLEF
jgi:hypothetical protein